MTDKTKRAISIRALFKDLAEENIAVRLTMPDGTILETLTGVNLPVSIADSDEGGAPVKNVFGKKVR